MSRGASSALALNVPPELVDALAGRVVELLAERGALGAPVTAEGWIGVDEAAAYIGKPRSRLYDLAERGALRHGRDGRSLLFRRSDLDAYLLGEGGDSGDQGVAA
jgi:excisionase family DNA binding protein